MPEEKITPIYSGKKEYFHWVGFGSGSGTNLRECAKVIKPVLIFSDKPKAGLLNLEELADVPKEIIDGYEWCGSWKKAKGNRAAEEEYERRSIQYNEEIVRALKQFERQQGITIDLIVLGGYMRLVKAPLLEAYKDKIINVHPADLSKLVHVSDKGVDRCFRKYIGDRAVHDAMIAGEQTTRSSVIMVDNGEDHGEILVQGPIVEVTSDFTWLGEKKQNEKLNEYAEAHQNIQKQESDWPALTTALKMIAEGRIALGTEKVYFNEQRIVYVDGKALPYEGFQITGKIKS